MRTLALYLPAIACGAMMLFMCIPMMRGMRKSHRRDAEQAPKEEIAELREEILRLKSERALEQSETVGG